MIIALVSMILIFECSALAVGKPNVELKEVCSNADVIVVGRVASLEITDKMIRRTRVYLDGRAFLLEPSDKRILQSKYKREYEFYLRYATLTIEQVIKGQFQDKEIVVEYPGVKKGQGVSGGLFTILQFLNPGERMVLFLRAPKQGTESYTFVNDYHSAIRIADSPAVTRLLEAQSPQGKPEEQIARLLTTSLEATSDTMFMEDLINLQGKQAIPAIKALLDHSKDPGTRENCLIALIRFGDYSRLKEAVEFLNSYPGGGQRLSARMAQVTDTNLVAEYYVPLLQHPSDFVRRWAAYAVRHARLRSAAPQMIKGLEDSDLDTRYQCLMGLGETVGGPAGIATDLFKKNESKYIMQWKTWWDTKGCLEFMKELGKTNAVPMAITNKNSVGESLSQSSTNIVAK